MGDDLPHNVHVHLYAHIPPERMYDFRNQAYRWLDFVVGDVSAANAIKIDTISEDNGIVPYCLKGTQDQVAVHFGVKGKSEPARPQGLIMGGRRSGTSRNLAPAARKAMDKELKINRKRNMLQAA